MVAGTWYNQDGLFLQYGTQKAIPEIGGDYLVYGEVREIEQYIPLVPTNWGLGMPPVGAPPTSFSGSGTALQAGIQSLTTLVPLQPTAPQTASGSALSLTLPQLFIERVEVVTVETVAGGSTIQVGLVGTQPGTPSSTFVQLAPNAQTQILQAFTIPTAPGSYTLWTVPNTQGVTFAGGDIGVTPGLSGQWLGITPQVTTTFTTPQGGQVSPESAWISTIASGAFTSGLLKLRIKYNLFGNINY